MIPLWLSGASVIFGDGFNSFLAKFKREDKQMLGTYSAFKDRDAQQPDSLK